MIKAIGLLSGGLDSTLACKLMLEQGIGVEAINFVTVFCTCTRKGSTCLASEKAARQLGIPLRVFNISEEYLLIVRNPKYGYGRNMNPCLDCRINIFRKAKEYMQERGASFIFTGEVLGERPMSQRLEAMRIIERDAGLEGLVLRPLSAKLLKPTIPEGRGWVSREKLLDIQGRGRKAQIGLADTYDIRDYPCPSGGCLLTDEGFSRRIRDLFKHGDGLRLADVVLLKLGRHFRISASAKAIAGRDEEENKKLESYGGENDLYFQVSNRRGSLVLLKGSQKDEEIRLTAAIAARYSDDKDEEETEIYFRKANSREASSIKIRPISCELLERYRI